MDQGKEGKGRWGVIQRDECLNKQEVDESGWSQWELMEEKLPKYLETR